MKSAWRTGRTIARANFPAASNSAWPSRALWLPNPSLLLADEPTGNLDETTGEKVFALLDALRRGRNLTTVLVTHNRRFAESCGRVLKLEGGVLCNI